MRSQKGFSLLGLLIVVVFSHSTSGNAKRWCAEAVPEGSGGGRTLGIDESGRVLAGLTSSSPCYYGMLDASGGVAVK